ncbi:nucleoside/nucleotide kinase family protein [Streptomyces sp. TRM 70351]|uniref:nucleoside/nucleotide kinase family protein n=1 Tax=Streptomyces sp. TRM 70351 TaxID=3116552 RepID=UPI002E7BF9C1|nr:nucleoside/nucleotide kinase family protein [Streptomyces sp. TRM 70351]MEE1928154.1 nucleoside/nucleotide kinase family protein [Streptomyces sp. TRM 70351]
MANGPTTTVDDALLTAAWRPGGRPDGRRAVLGLAGPPGAGKSTLARALVAGLTARHGAGSAGYVPLDGFHLSNAQLARLGLTARKGAPPTFDVAGYAALLARLTAPPPPGVPAEVYCPDFDRVLDEPVAARHVIGPDVRVVVTEGNYLACDLPGWAAARAHIDELWYVDAPAAVRHTRLVDRHRPGGQDAAAARERVRANDGPNGGLVEASRSAPWVARVVHGSGTP